MFKDFMEAMIPELEIRNMYKGETSSTTSFREKKFVLPLKELMPNVPEDLVRHNLWDLDYLKTFRTNLSSEEDKLKRLLKDVKELRARDKLLKKIGEWEGLVETMGRDICNVIPLKAMEWITIDEDKVWGDVASVARKLSEMYLNGEIEFPKEG